MDKLLILERKMIGAKYDGKKFKYLWYKRKLQKMKNKIERKEKQHENNSNKK